MGQGTAFLFKKMGCPHLFYKEFERKPSKPHGRMVPGKDYL